MIFQNSSNQKYTVITFIAFVIAGSSFIAKAQDLSVDDIIKKNIEARGGAEHWEKVKTIVMSGTYVNFSIPEAFVLYRQRPNLYRFDTDRLNKFTIHAFDGEKAWWVNPLMGEAFEKPSPIPTDKNLAKVTLRERFFEPVFWNYKEKGNSAVLAGLEDIDGESVYHLKVTLKNQEEEDWFISASTFLEFSMNGITYDFGYKNNFEVFFSDYRKVDGIVMPYLVESEYGIRYRSLEISKIEINKNTDSTVFKMPDPTTWVHD